MTHISGFIYQCAGFISEELWGRMHSKIHAGLSRVLAKIYHTRLSRFLIGPYCWWQYGDFYYHRQFKPSHGQNSYQTFQDFFTREFKEDLKIEGDYAWPCEGHLCDVKQVDDSARVRVKGEPIHIRTIFGEGGKDIPSHYYFANVFLHNNNYHHIHAPVSGKISRIEHIPGDLLLLRPRAYRDRPSLPALTNERVNLDIISDSGERWFLSIIGGPVVATIRLVSKLKLGERFEVGEKLGGFLMGSTCCMAFPYQPKAELDENVAVGQTL